LDQNGIIGVNFYVLKFDTLFNKKIQLQAQNFG